MAIRKAKQKSRFTQIPNETLQDTNLTFEARGVLALLLSKPEDWVIHKSWIQKQSPKCGRDKLTRILKELQDCGYLEKDPVRGSKGTFEGMDWLLYETPNRKTEKPSPDNRGNGKPTPTNTDLYTNTDINKDRDIRGTFSQQVEKSTTNVDPNILTIWKHVRTHVRNTYSGYELPLQPNERDINAISWGMGVIDGLTDEGDCLMFCQFILDEFGDATEIYNPFCRAAAVEQIPEHAWSDLFACWEPC
ncbi:hypothetical protein J7X11_002280 [Vibrio parahaemolyticus]|nr:hypothetical protein [Vibrio parahaemolyticus]